MTDPSATRLILVHGSMSSSAQWADYPSLLPEFDVVAVDLPGHGSRRAEPFSVSAAMTAISLAAGDLPVVLVGHSLGGYLAGVGAAELGERVVGLILIGATGNPRGSVAGPYRLFAWLTRRVSHPRLSRTRLAVARRLGVRDGLLPADASYADLPAIWRAVSEDCPPRVLRGLSCPVLFINGRYDQMRIDERRYLSLVARGELAIVGGATHLSPLTHAPAVAALIRDFVARL